MALLTNIDPSQNPLARQIVFDTIIDKAVLNPAEPFSVISIDFGYITPQLANTNMAKAFDLNTAKTIKGISLQGGTQDYFYSIYLPQYNGGNVMYFVPSVFNSNYVNSIQDLTTSNQLNQSVDPSHSPITWRKAMRTWVNNMNMYSTIPTSPSAPANQSISRNINISVIGTSSNRSDKTLTFQVTLKA